MKIKSTLQQFLQAKRRLLQHRAFDSIRHKIHSETLWHLNRRSLAGGLAAGLFAAFMPLPMQMLLAASLAILLQSNVPIAIIATWVSNPLTYAPIFYGNYKIGMLVLQFFAPTDAYTLEQQQSIFEHIQDVGAPFLMGSVLISCLAALLGYSFARLFWRFMTIRKLRRRQKKRR